MIHGAVAWLSDPKHPNYDAAAKAIERVYGGVSPDFTREGGSIPITTALEEATGMNVLLLPVGACDDMAHSQNEKYNIINLVNGVKVREETFLYFCDSFIFFWYIFFLPCFRYYRCSLFFYTPYFVSFVY